MMPFSSVGYSHSGPLENLCMKRDSQAIGAYVSVMSVLPTEELEKKGAGREQRYSNGISLAATTPNPFRNSVLITFSLAERFEISL